MRKDLVACITATLTLGGCATYATIPLLQKSFETAILTRSFTMLPLGADQQVVAIVGWGPGLKVQKIDIESGGAIASSSSVPIKEGELFYSNKAVLPGVKYLFTLSYKDGDKLATRSRIVQPVFSVVDQPALASPGTGSLDWLPYGKGGSLDAPASVQVASGVPDFTWGAMPSRNDATERYGFFLVVGKKDASSSLGIKPEYSAFLDEAKHPATASTQYQVRYGTKSDLPGISDLVSHMSNIDSLKVFAPTDAATASDGSVAPLKAGSYLWTVLTVNSDENRVSIGLGKISAPTDSNRWRVFCVPDATGKCPKD